MLKDKENRVEETPKKEGITRRKAIGLGAAAIGAVAAGGVLNASPVLSSEPVTIQINGRTVVGDVPAQIIKGRTMVPVRLVSESLGAKVDWIAASRTVKVTTSPNAAAVAQELPWKYQKLDVEAVRKAGYNYYKKAGCMYGAAAALLEELAKGNSVWNTIPWDMFKYGEGGAHGFGTLCGAINGGLAVMGMASGNNANLGGTFIGWYQENPFPSTKFDAYSAFKNQVTSVSKSPLCHSSVSIWCDKAGIKVNTDERKERCAKLTGDCAAYVAELLNNKLAQQPDPKFTPTAEYISCMGCHNGSSSVLDNEQGKMNCVQCHDDHTKK